MAAWREDREEFPRGEDPAERIGTWTTFALTRAQRSGRELFTVGDSRIRRFEHSYQALGEVGALLLTLACAPATSSPLPPSWQTWHRRSDGRWRPPVFDEGAVYEATLQVAAPLRRHRGAAARPGRIGQRSLRRGTTHAERRRRATRRPCGRRSRSSQPARRSKHRLARAGQLADPCEHVHAARPAGPRASPTATPRTAGRSRCQRCSAVGVAILRRTIRE